MSKAEINSGAAFDRCVSCREPILWAIMESGAAMPLDPDPCPDGNVAIRPTQHPAYRFEAKVLKPGQSWPGSSDDVRRKSHFATCSYAARHRKRGRS